MAPSVDSDSGIVAVTRLGYDPAATDKGERKMPLFREHRGSLVASLRTAIEIADRTALVEHLRKQSLPVSGDDAVQVASYGYDTRIAWDTYIVTLRGYGVVGFTNGPL